MKGQCVHNVRFGTQTKIMMTTKRARERERKRESERIKARMDIDYNGMVFDKLFAPFVRQ